MNQDGEFYRLVKTFSHEMEKEEEKEKKETEPSIKTKTKKPKLEDEKLSKIILKEEKEIGRLDKTVYKEYIIAVGGVVLVSTIFFLLTIVQISKIGTDFWLSFWAEDSELSNNTTFYFLSIFLIIGMTSSLMDFCSQISV